MILVDEYGALPALVGRPLGPLQGETLALTYSRAHRLTRALLDPGTGRVAVRGRFTRLVERLSTADRWALNQRLATPDPDILTIIDPRPFTRTAAAVQNSYPLSLLQAETLAVAVSLEWPIRFADPSSATDPVRHAADQLGLDLQTL